MIKRGRILGKRSNSHFDFLIKGKILKSKRSQVMGMPFTVIFSIILIVIFIIVAVIAIKIFWNPVGCGTNEMTREVEFKQNFQNIINDAWSADEVSSGENGFKISLPGQIKYVCFVDLEVNERGNPKVKKDDLTLYGDGPVFLYPTGNACEGFQSMNIQHIDIKKATSKENPLCIENGKKISIEKGFYDSLVTIKRQD